jgi:CheY-like chemotaxis protein
VGVVLRDVAQLTEPRWRDAALAEGRPISLYVEVEDGLPVQGSPESLREAFTNLVFNAVDALPDGGRIHLSAHRRGADVEVAIADSGTGISPEVRERVFEPFFTTKGERGTGLGLSMVFGVVERHGGQIRLDTAPGQGTTFYLTFPAASERPPAAVPTRAGAVTRPLRILAVDDQPTMLILAQRMLAQDGHTVVVATSGEEALERLAAEPFDLVISDVGMGAGMNGWQLAQQVHGRFPGVRFALATGWGGELDPEQARTLGVEAIVAKPYRVDDLRRLVAGPSPPPGAAA